MRKDHIISYFFIFLTVLTLLVSCNSRGSPRDSVNILITKDGLKNMRIALELYKKEYGAYPATLDEIIIKKGIEVKKVIEDAWGREYHYMKLGKSYVIFSKGRDGKPYTDDDIYPPQ